MALTDLLNTAGIAARVLTVTGDQGAAAAAAGWSAWILSLTGKPPMIVENADKTVSLTLDTEQTKTLRRYLDVQVHGAITTREKGPVNLNLDKSIGPWAMQYAVPIVVAAFIGGWFAHQYMGRRR